MWLVTNLWSLGLKTERRDMWASWFQPVSFEAKWRAENVHSMS